jgi:hypothetical protein
METGSITREEAKLLVGPGWSYLIDKLYNQFNQEEIPVFVSTVKEKYGTLRVYVGYASEEILEFIDEVEKESSQVCEQCGSPGRAWTLCGWIQTLCDACAPIDGSNITVTKDHHTITPICFFYTEGE